MAAATSKTREQHFTGGIDPNRAYAYHEFMLIAGLSRQTMSRLRRRGLVIRDTGAGSPTVLGKDWLDFVSNQPQHEVSPRGRHSKNRKASVAENPNKSVGS